MSQAPRAAAVSESPDLPQDLILLRNHIEDLPPEIREKLAPAMSRVVESTQRRRRILSLVQDALGQLRLDMKYLMFDLEATRRERDDYRSRLDRFS
ncbi:MAG: transcriptional regulator [Planctomycetia bacterium]|nr:transcriptional regulator [Planctomycetia bacterium]